MQTSPVQTLDFLYPPESFLLPFILLCLSPALSHLLVSPAFTPFLFPLQPLPSQLLRLIHHLSPFFLRSTCVFSRTGKRGEDGLRRWARYWLSFVFLICFISVWCWEEGRGGDAKTMRSSADYLARLPVKSVSLLHY